MRDVMSGSAGIGDFSPLDLQIIPWFRRGGLHDYIRGDTCSFALSHFALEEEVGHFAAERPLWCVWLFHVFCRPIFVP